MMKDDLRILRDAFNTLSNTHARHIVRSAARSIVLEELQHDFPAVYPPRTRYVKTKKDVDSEIVVNKY